MSPSQAIVASIHRYPVKSMMGEELNSVAITTRGVAGDRAYSLIDVETNTLVNAKHRQKWPEMFAYRARYTSPPVSPEHVPPVYIHVSRNVCCPYAADYIKGYRCRGNSRGPHNEDLAVRRLRIRL